VTRECIMDAFQRRPCVADPHTLPANNRCNRCGSLWASRSSVAHLKTHVGGQDDRLRRFVCQGVAMGPRQVLR